MPIAPTSVHRTRSGAPQSSFLHDHPQNPIRPHPTPLPKCILISARQHHALPHCHTDLVLAVDADTVLAPARIERIKPAFTDPSVNVAAGNVRTRFARTPWERGRPTEDLFGFHWHRPIQQLAGSPRVCSGCCSALRRTTLTQCGHGCNS
ncbi:glycosyltransferase [Nonomuraea maheshkhaliensis]|uniref:glycosyltransferase n=1 Tax=Nonomuraea maheshkhaliensis TaxID=419590 RepID=UPI003D159F75